MPKALTLLIYKLRFFFGPSFRGSAGPLTYLLFILIFVPSGFAVGTVIGGALKTDSTDASVNTLSTLFGLALSFGFLYSLGTGVTAHASELDFMMTAPQKPREYLLADLLFQVTSVTLVGGLAGAVAVLAVVSTLGKPLAVAVPVTVTMVLFVFFMFMIVQLLLVLRIKYPETPIRKVSLLLFFVNLIPAGSFISKSFPITYASLPIPETGFGAIVSALLQGVSPSLWDVAVAVVFLGACAAAWFSLSSTYIFHGVKPTLSAGFGQVDLSARMAQRRRMVTGLEGLTTRFGLSTDVGSDVGFMTRCHVLRIWRDGSIFYVVLPAVLFLYTSLSALSTTTMTAGAAASGAQVVVFPLAVLAVNWSYYEQGNLWLVTTASGYTGKYFKGLLLSFAMIGLMISAAFLGLRLAISHVPLTVEDFPVPVTAPIAAAIAACALLTRVKVKPGAFSPSILIVFIVVILVGVLTGLAVLGLTALVEGLGPVAQAFTLALAALVLIYAGLEAVARLARSFVAV